MINTFIIINTFHIIFIIYCALNYFKYIIFDNRNSIDISKAYEKLYSLANGDVTINDKQIILRNYKNDKCFIYFPDEICYNTIQSLYSKGSVIMIVYDKDIKWNIDKTILDYGICASNICMDQGFEMKDVTIYSSGYGNLIAARLLSYLSEYDQEYYPNEICFYRNKNRIQYVIMGATVDKYLSRSNLITKRTFIN